MKKKIVLFITILFILLFLPRIIILTISLVKYIQTERICVGLKPAYPTEKDELVPIPIYSVNPFVVTTNEGIMFIGDNYEVYGDGIWYGRVVLLWAGPNGASFLVTYNIPNLKDIKQRPMCRWFLPLGNY